MKEVIRIVLILVLLSFLMIVRGGTGYAQETAGQGA